MLAQSSIEMASHSRARYKDWYKDERKRMSARTVLSFVYIYIHVKVQTQATPRMISKGMALLKCFHLRSPNMVVDELKGGSAADEKPIFLLPANDIWKLAVPCRLRGFRFVLA